MQQSEHEEISELLHDAECSKIVWSRPEEQLQLVFDCLRRNTDGSPIEDRSVTFTLHNVSAVGAGYDSVDLEKRPSQFVPAALIGPAQLENWSYRRQETSLSINNRFDEQLVLESARLDWFEGDKDRFANSPLRFCLCFENWLDFGVSCIQVCLLVGAAGFEIHAGGVPLSVVEWRDQYQAWWKGWKRHWSGGPWKVARVLWHWLKGNPSGHGGIEETLIPAGEASRSQRQYSPPERPVFQIGETDAPAELIRPVQAWFEGAYAQDFDRMASAWPGASKSESERASVLKDQAVYDFGFWGFPRQVQQWWMEGARACVVVEGIEHVMPMDDGPAEDNKSVWACDLRLRDGRWVISSMSTARA